MYNVLEKELKAKGISINAAAAAIGMPEPTFRGKMNVTERETVNYESDGDHAAHAEMVRFSERPSQIRTVCECGEGYGHERGVCSRNEGYRSGRKDHHDEYQSHGQ